VRGHHDGPAGLEHQVADGIDLFYYYIANLNQIFLVILGTGVVLGAISSYLAVRRYLKV
jgi:cell division protein FtsX